MSQVPMASDKLKLSDRVLDRFDVVAQGYSAELVAEKWSLDKREMAELCYESHVRAVNARDCGEFSREIVPVSVSTDNGEYTVGYVGTSAAGCFGHWSEMSEPLQPERSAKNLSLSLFGCCCCTSGVSWLESRSRRCTLCWAAVR